MRRHSVDVAGHSISYRFFFFYLFSSASPQDTPPFTYEHGGVVTNMAVRVNGVLPIRCSAQLRVGPRLSVYSADSSSGFDVSEMPRVPFLQEVFIVNLKEF